MGTKRDDQQPPQPLTWLGGAWEHASWAHPLWAAAGTFAVGEAAHLAGISPWYAGGFTALAAASGLMVTAGHKFAESARFYMAGAGAAIGGWLTWACATSPLNAPSIVSAVAGTVLAAAAYPGMRHAQIRHEERVRAYQRREPGAILVDAPERPRSGEARRWETYLESVGVKGLTFIERVPNNAGFAIRFRLPRDGSVTFSHVVAATERIEIAWPGAHDGMVRAEQARNDKGRVISGELLLHFDVRDVLTETVMMPDEHGPLTVNEAFPIGLYTDGQPVYLTLREVTALVVGLRGRGKTNLFNVLVHQLSRCVDVCLWGIDLKGGRAIKPWLTAWLEADTDDEGNVVERPVFDWVATTRAEAHRMMVGAQALIEQRGQQGSGGSKITPSIKQPAVVILCDEVAALTGMHSGPRFRSDGKGPTARDFSGLFTLTIQLGRSEAVDCVLFTQRSTVSMTGGGDLKSQCTMRIGLGVSNAQDARSVFDNSPVAAKLLSKLEGKATRGAMLIRDGDGARVVPAKGYFYGDDRDMLTRVRRASVLHWKLPATLDIAGQRAVHAAVLEASEGQHGYLDRWDTDRAAHLYSDAVPPEVTDADIAAMDDDEQEATDTGDTGEKRPSTGGGNRFFSYRPSTTSAEPLVEEQPSAVDDDPEWERLVAAFEGPDAPEPEPEQPDDPDRQAYMVEVVDQAGEAGITASRIYEAVQDRYGKGAPARQTLHRWLNRAKEDQKITQPARRGRYFTPRNMR